jgi:hypothetical protein
VVVKRLTELIPSIEVICFMLKDFSAYINSRNMYICLCFDGC